ncbi:TPA: hypothetical protein H1009_01660, partial [archaeon]|nr:hypothetical protein [Candidatus Naiadarchaeales archaeon SRR2090153.bin461]
TGGGDSTEGSGGGGYSGASPTISVNNRSTNIPNAQKETEVFITIPITKNNVTKSETYRAVISDIVSSSANVRFGHIKGQLEPAITLNPGQEAFVDLNGDGVNDVKITLNSVAKGLADITFDVIVKQRGTGVRGPTFDELLEDEYGEEGAEGARELIITRLLAYTSVMALLAVVFVIRYIPETFGLKRRKKS